MSFYKFFFHSNYNYFFSKNVISNEYTLKLCNYHTVLDYVILRLNLNIRFKRMPGQTNTVKASAGILINELLVV